jgi:predicted transposase YbfD/YdcC
MVVAGAIGEGVVFLEHFRDLPDPRQAGKVVYPLDEILLLCLLAVLAGAETFTDIARFGTKKLDLLRRFRPFRDGTPAHDHLGDIFATLDAEKFQHCFVAWVSAQAGAPADVIAIDGKTMRRSADKKRGKAAIHMVSAFAARQRLVLGQVKVAEKSNEIVAIPKLLEMMAIDGAIVTIDAIGCQRDIARAIIDKKADYILALKGNQGTLRDDVEVSLPSRRPMTSRTPPSADSRRSMAITDNVTTINHMALNLLRNAPGQDSLRLRRKVPLGTMTSSQA